MTLCPVALAVGCRRCPVFAICPVKGVIGDQPPAAAPPLAAKRPVTVKQRRAGPRRPAKRRRG